MWPEPWFQELLDSGEVRLERDGFGLMSTWWNPGDGYPAKCSRCSTRIPAGTPRRQRYYNPNAAEYLGMYLTVCFPECPPFRDRLRARLDRFRLRVHGTR